MSLRETGSMVRSVVAVACLVGLAGCGPFDSPPAPAKVAVDTLSTSILFGVPSQAAAAAGQAPSTPQLPPQFTETLPGQPEASFFEAGNLTFPSVAPATECPAASATSFPAEPAGSGVTTMPASGAYRWVTGGSYQMAVVTLTISLPLPQFEQRVVRHAQPFTDPVPSAPGSPPDYAFTYQTIEPRGDGTALLMYWQVKANANSVDTGLVPTVADPEGGLVLKQVDTIDASGKDTGAVFQSAQSAGLLMLPLPVQPGAAFSSTSPDTSPKANTLQLSGTVGTHEVIDACGTNVQAWGVDAKLTTGTSSTTAATLHYDVATQMGALMIAFNVDGPFFGIPYKAATARLGQTSPDPVPDKYK
jgi:predicted small lipoprotein YifL